MTDEPKAGSAPVEKAGVDFDAAFASARATAKCGVYFEDKEVLNLARAYLALRAELAVIKAQQINIAEGEITPFEKCRAELAQAKEEIASRKAEFESLSRTIKQLAAAREEIERLKKQSDVRLDVFYQLWDLADRAVGGDISETAFIDGRKEVIAILARKAGGGE